MYIITSGLLHTNGLIIDFKFQWITEDFTIDPSCTHKLLSTNHFHIHTQINLCTVHFSLLFSRVQHSDYEGLSMVFKFVIKVRLYISHIQLYIHFNYLLIRSLKSLCIFSVSTYYLNSLRQLQVWVIYLNSFNIIIPGHILQSNSN